MMNYVKNITDSNWYFSKLEWNIQTTYAAGFILLVYHLSAPFQIFCVWSDLYVVQRSSDSTSTVCMQLPPCKNVIYSLFNRRSDKFRQLRLEVNSHFNIKDMFFSSFHFPKSHSGTADAWCVVISSVVKWSGSVMKRYRWWWVTSQVRAVLLEISCIHAGAINHHHPTCCICICSSRVLCNRPQQHVCYLQRTRRQPAAAWRRAGGIPVWYWCWFMKHFSSLQRWFNAGTGDFYRPGWILFFWLSGSCVFTSFNAHITHPSVAQPVTLATLNSDEWIFDEGNEQNGWF